jgi:hypothetical protein
MGKRILSVFAGLITAFIVIFLLENLWKVIYPPPANLNLEDKAVWSELMKTMPMGALWCLILGYAAGSFAGGLVAAKVAVNVRVSIVVGAILMVGGIANLVMIEHPLWFIIVSNLVYIPFAYLGGKMVVKTQQPA